MDDPESRPPLQSQQWSKVSGRNVFIAMHVILLIISLIIAVPVSTIFSGLMRPVVLVLVVLAFQLLLILLGFYLKGLLVAKGIDPKKASKMVYGEYYQISTSGTPQVDELSGHLNGLRYETEVIRDHDIYFPQLGCYITFGKHTSQYDDRHASSRRTREITSYNVQLGPLSPGNEAKEARLQGEIAQFLAKKGLI